MTLSEILQIVRKLSEADKRTLYCILADELKIADENEALSPGAYFIPPYFEATEAGDILMDALRKESSKKHADPANS
jgi:hypothetical protein